jgi:L-xylulokinase
MRRLAIGQQFVTRKTRIAIAYRVIENAARSILGAAICAGVASGQFKPFQSAAHAMVEVAYSCFPNPAYEEMYAEKYNLCQDIISSLMPIRKRL